MDDFMELQNGRVPLENGWFLDKPTGNRIDPSGNVYGPDGSVVKEVTKDEEGDSGQG